MYKLAKNFKDIYGLLAKGKRVAFTPNWTGRVPDQLHYNGSTDSSLVVCKDQAEFDKKLSEFYMANCIEIAKLGVYLTASNISEDYISFDIGYLDTPKVTPILGIDWKLLRDQKQVLIKMIDKTKGDDKTGLSGILTLIDAIQDYAVDTLGVPEKDVFLFIDE
jgi:hypothetical protein